MSDMAGINYTVKEILLRQDEKLDRIEQKMDKKADASMIEALRNKIDAAADRAVVASLELKLTALEKQIQIQDSINKALAEKSARQLTGIDKILLLVLGIAALAVQIYLAKKAGR